MYSSNHTLKYVKETHLRQSQNGEEMGSGDIVLETKETQNQRQEAEYQDIL